MAPPSTLRRSCGHTASNSPTKISTTQPDPSPSRRAARLRYPAAVSSARYERMVSRSWFPGDTAPTCFVGAWIRLRYVALIVWLAGSSSCPGRVDTVRSLDARSTHDSWHREVLQSREGLGAISSETQASLWRNVAN